MRKHISQKFIASIFLLFSLNDASAYDKSANQQEFLNKDGSRIVVKNLQSTQQAVISLVSNTHTHKLLTLKPVASANPSFFSVVIIDIDKDGFGDIEESNQCGNKVCEKTIYRFNPKTKKYVKFFFGGYNEISLDDDFLISSGSSGCCNYEYQIYKFDRQKYLIEKAPSYIVNVSNTGDDKNSKVECSFTDKNAKATLPLRDKWKQYCEVYGKSYKLITP